MIPDWLTGNEAICHVRRYDASQGIDGEWPDWLPDECRKSIASHGIDAPWRHQRELADLAHCGHHVAINTPTASGKSLGYLMPIMAAAFESLSSTSVLGADPNQVRIRLLAGRASALYLSPTKALAHDQWRAARKLGPSDWKVATLDGDSDQAERRFARDQASFVLSNPDMLHRSVLPHHARWASFLRGLRYVVIDEAHRYRGVFGAQVSAVIRRLRRLCAHYGADPTFIVASATTVDAGVFGATLIGETEPLRMVKDDCSPHCGRDVVLWRPRESPTADAAMLLASLVDAGSQVISFVPSRSQAELVAMRASALVTSGRTIMSYRSGYLPSDRRTLENSLQQGEIAGVAATSALELGVDIAGVDVVIIAGMPGTLAAFWQQAGRAGRRDHDALVIAIAQDDPRDSYLFDHPELIFDTPVENTVIFPDNPRILGPHIAAAAQEMPLTSSDVRWFGPKTFSIADQLCKTGLLRKRTSGWFWTKPHRAVDAIDLRSDGGQPLNIIDVETGRIIGVVDHGAIDRTVHPDAVYLHQGEQWIVEELDLGNNHALVRSATLTYVTQPRSITEARLMAEHRKHPLGRGFVSTGEIAITSQVIGYLRRDEETGKVWDETPLDLPERHLYTLGIWFTIPPDVVSATNLSPARAGAAVHAAEHAAVALLPLFAPCDRWDIGGVSAVLHPDTDACAIIVHDNHPGGAGFAEQGFTVAEEWFSAILHRLRSCECETGCPKCVISPTCSNANQMIDKSAARILIECLLDTPHH